MKPHFFFFFFNGCAIETGEGGKGSAIKEFHFFNLPSAIKLEGERAQALMVRPFFAASLSH